MLFSLATSRNKFWVILYLWRCMCWGEPWESRPPRVSTPLFYHFAFPRIIKKTFCFQFLRFMLTNNLLLKRLNINTFNVISGPKHVIIILKFNIYIFDRSTILSIKLLWIWIQLSDPSALLWSTASNSLVPSSRWEHWEEAQLTHHVIASQALLLHWCSY